MPGHRSLAGLGRLLHGTHEPEHPDGPNVERWREIRYLSQVERRLHQPSVRVLRSIADALNVSAETLFEQGGTE